MQSLFDRCFLGAFPLDVCFVRGNSAQLGDLRWVSDFQTGGHEPFLEGSRVDVLRTQLYYICFILVLDGARWSIVGCYDAKVPNLGLMYPQGYICLSEGVHLKLTIEDKYIFACLLFPNIHTYISEFYFQKPLYAYCYRYLWLIRMIMIKYFVIRDFRGTCSYVEILKGYIIIRRVHGQRKVGEPSQYKKGKPLL